MIRSFIALPVPDGLRPRLALLQMLLPLPRRVDPGDFHLTLAFLGKVPDHLLQEVHEELGRISMPPFTLELSGVASFGGARPRLVFAGVAPSEPLQRLQARAARVAVRAGIVVQTRGFRPHVTLGRFTPPEPRAEPRADPRARPRAESWADPGAVARLEAAMVAQQGFRAGPWEVTGFGVYASHPAASGPKYDELAAYSLV